MIQGLGAEEAEIVAVLDSPRAQTSTLTDWVTLAPPHLLANNLRTEPGRPPGFRGRRTVI